MAEVSLRVKVFLYYINTCKEKNSTNKFPKIEQDLEQFEAGALERVCKRINCSVDELPEHFNWAVIAEKKIMADERIQEERQWLVENGFLWKKEYEKRAGINSKMTTTYFGLTEKGKKWAPEYFKKYSE